MNPSILLSANTFILIFMLIALLLVAPKNGCSISSEKVREDIKKIKTQISSE